MDNDRPSLDIKYIDDICPDKNGTSDHSFMNWGLHDELSKFL
jgi:hypothetical protein